MEKFKGYKKVYEVSLALMAFLMLVVPKLIAIGIIIHLGVTITGIIKRKLKFSINPMNVLMLLLYIAYVIGSLYTDHPDIAGRYLEYKMVLVFFPILFSFQLIEKLSLKLPSIGLFLGVIVLMFLGAIHSIGLYLDTSSFSSFTSGQFSYIHHPTYFAAYAFVAMLLVRYAKTQQWLGDAQWKYTVLLLIMILGQLLTLSMAGILILLIYGAVSILTWINKRFGKLAFITVLILSPVLLFTIVSTVPGISTQFETSKKFMVEYVKDPIAFVEVDQTYVQGDETRLIMWTVTSLEFAKHPMGVGTGNIDEVLDNRLLEFGQVEIAAKDINPHNQFLQTGLEIGVIGLLILIGIFLYAFYLGWISKNAIIVFIAFNLGFNCLFESMLQRQSGIVFFMFWLCVMTVVILGKNSKINNNPSIEN